jgi:SOS-response transcriptional repressor LexA
MTEVHERLAIARERAGFETAAEAARALGVKEQTYYAHENGNSGLRAVVAERYAKRFKVSLDWLLTGLGEVSPSGAVPYEIEVAGLPLLGSIQAGHWVETTGADLGTPEMVPVVRDPRFPHAAQYCLRVVGDSMDEDYPEGSLVTCVAFADSGLRLAEGMIVHVERQRDAGQLVEITLKAVERRRGTLMLVPHSSNPAHRPFALNGDPGTEVFARGVVLGGWSPRKLPNL